MIFKIVAGLIAAALLLGFLVPYVLKMQDIALGAVIVVGLAAMARDLWESLQEKED
ncbi:MAG TPA: hypothetical protein VLC73_19760 [Burkholderiales bacterium]|nr:hypothetical protein [Burkholderiales bacterium]